MKPNNKKSNKQFVPKPLKLSRAIGGAATVILTILFGEYIFRIALPVWDAVCEVAEQHFAEVFNLTHFMTVVALVMMFTVFVLVFNRLWVKRAQESHSKSGEEEERGEPVVRHSNAAGQHVAPANRGGAFLKKDAS